ncbi:hypothetical protein KEM56_003139, partial [Ascosphaera pollenicola]
IEGAKKLGDRTYPELIEDIRCQLINIGAKYPDTLYYDMMMLSVSQELKNFLQQRMDQAIQSGDDSLRPNRDFAMTVDQMRARLIMQDTSTASRE